MKTWPGTTKQQLLVFEGYENIARNNETANLNTGRLWKHWSTFTSTSIHKSLHVHLHLRLYVYIYLHLHIHLYVNLYIYMHMYIPPSCKFSNTPVYKDPFAVWPFWVCSACLPCNRFHGLGIQNCRAATATGKHKCIYTYTYTDINMYRYTRTKTYLHVHTWIHTCPCMHINGKLKTSDCPAGDPRACVYVRVRVCVWARS